MQLVVSYFFNTVSHKGVKIGLDFNWGTRNHVMILNLIFLIQFGTSLHENPPGSTLLNF